MDEGRGTSAGGRDSRIDLLVSAAGPEFSRNFIAFMCDPALGARSKREIELKFVELLYGSQVDKVTVADVASRLAIPRSRARALLLEIRSRVRAGDAAYDRHRRLANFLRVWKDRQIEVDGSRLRFAVEDPQMVDLLKDEAFRAGVVLDGSFAGDIVTLTWAGWARLLRNILTKSEYGVYIGEFGARIRQRAESDMAESDELGDIKAIQDSEPQSIARLAKLLSSDKAAAILRYALDLATAVAQRNAA